MATGMNPYTGVQIAQVTCALETCCESDLTIRNQLRYDRHSQRKWIGPVQIEAMK
jgi:hypothetical protein